jgi:flavin reductase (DIM6/NTAB) family NADH-FMN oxidoreductase RutF
VGEIKGRLGSHAPEDDQPLALPFAFEQHRGVEPTEDIARWLRRHYASAVTVVTTTGDDEYFGVTVSAFTYISLDPLLVFAALGKQSQTGERILESGSFGVSMLTNRQRFLADRFAGRAPLVDRRFEDVPHLLAATGSPLLADSIAWLDCRLDRHWEGGDHHVYIGHAEAVGHGLGDESDPLIYYESVYHSLR